MKSYLILLLAILVFKVNAQDIRTIDTGTFLLHKIEQYIGKETYRCVMDKKGTSYDIDFSFSDRGSPVSLKAELKLTPGFEPLGLNIKGKTARSSTINDTISIAGNEARLKVDDSSYNQKISPLTFPIAGYSPGTVQQVLLQFWKIHSKPSTINTLPFGSVQIKEAGTDKLDFEGKQLVLNRYTIAGLVWGNEILWTDGDGKLMCLITNDAEFDKLEMMRAPYETLLPELIKRAAACSMELFEKAMPKPSAESKVIAIVGGNLVDVVNSTTINNSVVIIENGKVKAVGKIGEVSIPKDCKIIDAKGKTLLPGLWDMHAHFEQAEWGPAYLAAGVTTVRDCGNEFGYINAIKNAIDEGKGVGPEILKAGVIDGKGPYGIGIIQADTKEEAVKYVDRYVNNGFVQIKIYSSVKPAIVKAICDEAHRLGVTVTGHIPIGMTLRQGVDSGMDMVNHVRYVYAIMKHNNDLSVDFGDSASIAAIKFIKDHHVVIDPTLGVFEMNYRNIKDDITKIEPAFYSLPPSIQPELKNTGQDEAGAAKFKPLYQSLVKIVKLLYDSGVPIIAGTDQGFPGYSLDRELELYVGAGLSPMQAIQSATITPAQAMKLDKLSGSITTGKNADITIVDGDPLSNISNVRKVSLIIKAGQIYDPPQLHQLVGFSK